jgi:hypothetical protein
MSSLTSGGWPDNPYWAVPGVLDDDKVLRRRFPPMNLLAGKPVTGSMSRTFQPGHTVNGPASTVK